MELAPRDGQRQAAALFLTIQMLRFAWLHELFHCLNSHTGLRAAQGRETALQELSEPALGLAEVESAADATSSAVDDCCMEFDADRTALWAMIGRQAGGQEPLDGLRALPVMLRLMLTFFAAVLMTFLFDQSVRRHAVSAGTTYPVAYHRLHNLVRTLASNLFDPSGQTKELFEATLAEMNAFNNFGS